MSDPPAPPVPASAPPPVPTAPAVATAAAKPKQASAAIPVSLNEAALDSPTFRATAVHFADQIDGIERWLDGYVRATAKVVHDLMALEETINSYVSKIIPPSQIAEAIVDHDYTYLAMKRCGDASREWWSQVLGCTKKMDPMVMEPIRHFISGDLRTFKDVRKALDTNQKAFDATLARYVSQSKAKEPSALREDAFAVYETRKAYLKASMDYCQLAPQLRFTLDKLLVRVFSDIFREIKRSRELATSSTKWSAEIERIRGWSKEMESSETIFKRELQAARRDIGESTLLTFKPSRELDDYSSSTVPFLGSRGPVHMQHQGDSAVISEKQGWLFLRTITGKPVRHTWVRRWYYCRDGIFGWLVQGPLGVLQGDEIGVLLCNAKPAVQEERRFCFEVKTKNQTMLLQAETQGQLTEWLEVFEVAKRKAFEASWDRSSAALPASSDPAFFINPPIIPEFSAKSLDTQLGPGDEVTSTFDRVGTLPVPGEGGLAPRASFDVSTGAPRRSITTISREFGREEGESSREHAARIMQKLDLHRKATFGSGGDAVSAGSAGPAGGIASLISASHNILPVYPATASMQGSSRPAPTTPFPPLEIPPGSLAPSTLARPPTSTSLSRTAVVVAAERGATSDFTKHIPTAIMANYWGSSPWGTLTSGQEAPPKHDEDSSLLTAPETHPADTEETPTRPTHRKTTSVDTSISKPALPEKQQVGESFPPGYPVELRMQHPQFRLLFPNVPVEEKLLLVFRAAWSSSSSSKSSGQGLAGNGRIYVTAENMYFYGHQMGLVVAYKINLDLITEVTAAPGRDCDFVFLHLGQDTNETGYTRITIKTFLEDIYLLHARLNLLVDDLQAEEPMDLLELVSALQTLEKEDLGKKSPSVDSWEEISSSTPMDNGTAAGRPVPSRYNSASSNILDKPLRKHTPKFQLPSHPVDYSPEDMQKMIAERHFEISAKACFHVLFGDKSFVFPKLYFERRAQQIAQGPWMLADHGRMKREFQFRVENTDMLGRAKPTDVVDFQTIDVFSDHITYVVTHVKTPWHLPHSQYFKLVTKVVITHIGKSKCRLAIYIKVDWSKTPTFSKNLVERQALDDAAGDAEELAEVATDQVRKLGPHSRTKRAIQVYGHIGQQTQVVVFSPSEAEAAKKQVIQPRTLTAILFETARSLADSAVTSLILWAFAGLRKFFKVVTAHRIILLLLGLSVFTNLFLTSKESSTWWAERRAAKYMKRIGVGPNMMMSKAIYIADLADAAGSVGHNETWPQDSACYDAFRAISTATDLDSPVENVGSSLATASSRATARRLRRTRQRLGSYRHDLLVAMRIVNSVEREMVQSEWENWLADENLRCEQLKLVLDEEAAPTTDKTKKAAAQKAAKQAAVPAGQTKESLRKWYDEYCRSCRSDQFALDAGHGTMLAS